MVLIVQYACRAFGDVLSVNFCFTPRFGEIDKGGFMDRSYRMFPNLPLEQRGEVRCLQVDSALLKSNPWGDPHCRDVWVYIPPGYTADSSISDGDVPFWVCWNWGGDAVSDANRAFFGNPL